MVDGVGARLYETCVLSRWGVKLNGERVEKRERYERETLPRVSGGIDVGRADIQRFHRWRCPIR